MIHYTYVEWADIPHSHTTRPKLGEMSVWKDSKGETSDLMMNMALHKSLRERGGLIPGEATRCRVFYASDKIEKKDGEPVAMLLNEYKVGPKE